jgi:hypothetical protein
MGARGPMADPNARRRNKRKPNTPLPLDGPEGRAPNSPYNLGEPGAKWWKWAWKLPQAAAWDNGSLYWVARRAQLEDDLAAVDDPGDLLGRVEDSVLRIIESEDPEDVPERLNYLGQLIGKLKSIAGGRGSILKEMRELDNRLGLNPEAMKRLGWVLESPEEEEEAKAQSPGPVPDNVTQLPRAV